MFDHEVPAVISAMRDITVGVFENIEITSVMDVYARIKYMKRILRGPALNKYWHVLAECKESEKELAGDKLSLGMEKVVSMEQF